MRLSAVYFLLLCSCTVEDTLPDAVLISCGEPGGACPSGYTCDATLGLCLPASPRAGASPGLSGSAEIAPAVVAAGRTVRVTLTADRPLLTSPVLELVSGAFSAPLVYESGDGAGPYVFSYLVSGDEPEGVASVRGDLADREGRVSRGLAIGTVELDFTAPLVDSVGVDEAVSANGRLWVDTEEVTLRPLLATGEDAPASARVSGDVVADADLAYTDGLPAVLSSGDGGKLVRLELADAAGNVTPLAIALSLESTSPSATIILDAPVGPEIYLNAASLTVFYHANATLPPDFDAFVFSVDDGVSWMPSTVPGALTLASLAQDATTSLWIRERDVFGNLTPPFAQGLLVVHEDSQPPSAPHAFTPTISGLLTSQVGVLLEASRDPGGGPVDYQVIGGPYADYTSVGPDPHIVLSGAATAATTVYVIRAVDRAGNASSATTITVADNPMTPILNACGSGCFSYDFYSSGGLGVLSQIDSSVSDTACTAGAGTCRMHLATLCRRYGTDNFGCSSLQVAASRTTSSIVQGITVGGRVLAFTDISNSLSPIIRAIYFGPDESLQTSDDGTLITLGSGNCQVSTAAGMFFGNHANAERLSFYNYGPDGRPGTADGEGTSVVVAASSVYGFNPCRLQATTHHVLWTDDRGVDVASYVYNLGADGKPGGGDDAGEWMVPTGDLPLLLDGRVLAHGDDGLTTVYDAGPDDVFGTGDDTSSTLDLPWLDGAQGDKAYASDLTSAFMIDVGSNTTLPLHNQTFGGSKIYALSASPGLIFAGLNYGSLLPTIPGAYIPHGEPLSFQVADLSGEGGPSGVLDGDLYLFFDGADAVPTLLNTRVGGVFRIPEGEAVPADIDLANGYLVWVDTSTDSVRLYYVGADGSPGTADDRGPVSIVSGGTYRWPRVDGHVVIWADMSADADSEWVGANLSSTLQALDLGADGWLGGGDDVPHAPAAGSKVVTPDIAGGEVVYLDYSADATGLCEGSRGAPTSGSCQPAVMRISLSGGAPSQIAAAGTFKADLQIFGNRVVWSEYVVNNWNVRVHTLGGATVTAAGTAYDERAPSLYGTTLAYYTDVHTMEDSGAGGVFVVDLGVDTTFGTGDDVVVRAPAPIQPRSFANPFGDFRPVWLDAEHTASGGGLLVVRPALDLATGGTGIALTDNGSTVDSVTLDAPTWQRVEDLRLKVTLTHAAPVQLELKLIAPSGSSVVMSSTVVSGSSTFDMDNTASMFDFFGEPLAGTWQLEVRDKAPGATGVLNTWSIEHRR